MDFVVIVSLLVLISICLFSLFFEKEKEQEAGWWGGEDNLKGVERGKLWSKSIVWKLIFWLKINK